MYNHPFPTQACVAGNGEVGSLDDNVSPLRWYQILARGRVETASSKAVKGLGKCRKGNVM